MKHNKKPIGRHSAQATGTTLSDVRIFGAINAIATKIKEDYGVKIEWNFDKKIDISNDSLEEIKAHRGFQSATPSRFIKDESDAHIAFSDTHAQSFAEDFKALEKAATGSYDKAFQFGFKLKRDDSSNLISHETIINILNGMQPVVRKTFPIFAPGTSGLEWVTAQDKSFNTTNLPIINAAGKDGYEKKSDEISFNLPASGDVGRAMLSAAAGIYHSLKHGRMSIGKDGNIISNSFHNREAFGDIPQTAERAATGIGQAREFRTALEAAGVPDAGLLIRDLQSEAMQAAKGRKGGIA